MQDWLSRAWYETVAWVTAAGSILAFSSRFEGGANVPRQGPVLLLANHQCYLDPVFIGLATRRQLSFLARKSLWKSRALGWFINSLNAVPVDQEGVAKEGLKTVISLLERGRAVVIFPEGQRTLDGKMGPLMPGVHLIIKKTRPLIVPVGIAGAYDAWPRWRPYPIPAPLFLPGAKGTVAVSIGKPFDSTHLAEMPRDQAIAELFTTIHKMWRRAEHLRRK
jgi:1-acyl-sn-glycerol-3-phosphate acyltransferase